MALICVENTVADYAKFRAHFDKNADMRSAAGISNPRVFRSADDGNNILVIADVADPAKAREALRNPEYRAAMQNAGLVGTPKIYIIE